MPRPLTPLALVVIGCVIACGGGGQPRGGEPAPPTATPGPDAATGTGAVLLSGVRPDSPVGKWLTGIDAEQNRRAVEARAAWDRDVQKARDGVKNARVKYDAAAVASFSQQVKARSELLDAHTRLRAVQEVRPKVAAVSTSINIELLRVGAIGQIQDVVHVNQITSSRTMIVKTVGDTPLWVECNTVGLVDQAGAHLTGVYECYGTERYVTVIGGTRTITAIRHHPGVEVPTPPVVEVPAPDPIPDVPEPTREPVPPPAGGWSSEWKHLGQVKARVRAVAHSAAPVVDRKGDRTPSPEKVALVWLEFQNAGPQPRALRRYQQSGECVLAAADGAPILAAVFPGGRSLDDVTPFTRPLPPAGEPAVGLLAFTVPSPPAGQLTLTLDATRVGESGRYAFTIPAAAWR